MASAHSCTNLNPLHHADRTCTSVLAPPSPAPKDLAARVRLHQEIDTADRTAWPGRCRAAAPGPRLSRSRSCYSCVLPPSCCASWSASRPTQVRLSGWDAFHASGTGSHAHCADPQNPLGPVPPHPTPHPHTHTHTPTRCQARATRPNTVTTRRNAIGWRSQLTRQSRSGTPTGPTTTRPIGRWTTPQGRRTRCGGLERLLVGSQRPEPWPRRRARRPAR
jgi:hypothetical protein